MNANSKLQLTHDFSFKNGLLSFFGIRKSRVFYLRQKFIATTLESSIRADWDNISTDIEIVFDSEKSKIRQKETLLDACE